MTPTIYPRPLILRFWWQTQRSRYVHCILLPDDAYNVAHWGTICEASVYGNATCVPSCFLDGPDAFQPSLRLFLKHLFKTDQDRRQMLSRETEVDSELACPIRDVSEIVTLMSVVRALNWCPKQPFTLA